MSKLHRVNSDVLIIGSGFAGLRAASAAVRKGAGVVVLGKGPRATPDILGFNVAVEKEDSISLYEEDLRKSSYRISNPMLETILVNSAGKEMDFLETIGFRFDRKTNGEYDVLHVLGARYPRLVHYKAMTGIEASRLMSEDCKKQGVLFENNIFVYSLIKADERIIGVAAIDMESGKPKVYTANSVILATGGCGAVYDSTTYPRGINGDGVAMVYQAGGEIIDMEFQQFEPCAFVYPDAVRGKVIPTTLLREGAVLRNGENREFMGDYGLDRSSVQKYGLSLAMFKEIREGRGTPHGGIYYDVTMMPRKMVVEDHAIFYDPALSVGIDLMKTPAEVGPAAHTSLGGVKINEKCETSLKALFAAGEVAGGFYGANRIGGSAGIETLVFGKIAGENSADFAETAHSVSDGELDEYLKGTLEIPEASGNTGTVARLSSICDELGKIMSMKVGIIRNRDLLKSAEADIEKLSEKESDIVPGDLRSVIGKRECRNMLDVSKMMILSSLVREESRGVFCREDYPERDDEKWLGNIVIRRLDNEMNISFKPKSE